MTRSYLTLMLMACFLTLYSQATVEPDYMLLGRETLPQNGENITDTFLFIDYAKGALVGGRLNNSPNWSPDSIKVGSLGFGYGAQATGDNAATALGYLTKATGNDGATALGSYTTASGNYGAMALGSNTIASGSYGATATGRHTHATGHACTVVGIYNDGIVASGTGIGPTSPLFIVGNGDSNPGRSNALVVRKNGVVSFENYTFPDLDGTMGQVLGTNGSGNLDWVDGDDWTNSGSNIYRSSGSVVIGNAVVPAAKLEVNNPSTNLPAAIFENAVGTNNKEALKVKTLGTWRGAVVEIDNATNGAAAIFGKTNGTGHGLVIDHAGSNGNLAIFQTSGTWQARIDRTGKGFFNGGTQTGGADLAEAMMPEGDASGYEYGDVLVISLVSDRRVEKSSAAYSSLVAGVYATKPGVLLTEENVEHDLSGHLPMGVIGIIPTKVCAEGGPIKRGDLLVTSSRPGVAMKADMNKLQIGQALGKALQNSEGDTDLINVLVNVQ